MRLIANFFIFLYNFTFGRFFGSFAYYAKPDDLTTLLQKNDPQVKTSVPNVVTSPPQAQPQAKKHDVSSTSTEQNANPQENTKESNISQTTVVNAPQKNQKPDAIITDTPQHVLDALTTAFPNPLELNDEQLEDYSKKGYEKFKQDRANVSETKIGIAGFKFCWDNAEITISNKEITNLTINEFPQKQIAAVQAALNSILGSAETVRGSKFADGVHKLTVNMFYNKPAASVSHRYWHQDATNLGYYPYTSIVYFNHKGTEANLNLAVYKRKIPDCERKISKTIQTHTHPSVTFDNYYFEHQVSDIRKTGEDNSVRCLLTIFWGEPDPGYSLIKREVGAPPSIEDRRTKGH